MFLPTEIDPNARFASGPSLDGKGEFRVVEPRVASAPEPNLQKAPPEVHAGLEATAPDGAAGGMGVAARFTRLASDVADRLTPDAGTGAAEYEEMTKEELLAEARKAGIEGRSSMDKDQLVDALRTRA